MRLLTLCLLLFAVPALASGPQIFMAAASRDNYVTYNFDDGTLQGWAVSGGAALESGTAHSASYGVSIGGNATTDLTFNTLVHGAGNMTFWVYYACATSCGYNSFTAAGQTVSGFTSNTWSMVTIPISAGTGGVTIHWGGTSSSPPVYVDDIQVPK